MDLSLLGCYSYDVVGKLYGLYEWLCLLVDNLFWVGEVISERFFGIVYGVFVIGVMVGNECFKRFVERCWDL